MSLFKSILGKVKEGLGKTRDALVEGAGGLKSLLLGRRLDEELIGKIESCLIRADVGRVTVARLIDGLRQDHRAGRLEKGEDALAYLRRELKALWPPEARELRLATTPPTVILVTGVNGAGKTTSIAKLCYALRSQGKSVLLGACDTFRAGAVRQLEIWGERLGVEVVKGQQGGDPAAVAFDACVAAKARGVDVLILDTAGRLQTQDPLMRQLSKIRGVASKQVEGAPHETLLVLDATAGQNALRQAAEFDRALAPEGAGPGKGVSGIVLSKLDGTAKGGIVVAIREATSIPVKFIGVGERPEDLQPFDPDEFVEALLAIDGNADSQG